MREEEKKRSSHDSSIKRLFKKRWTFPAIYLASAAIIITGGLWYQNSTKNALDSGEYDYKATDIPGKPYNEPAVEVNKSLEEITMPVDNPDTVVYKKQFYDNDSDKKDQEAALVFFNNAYHPNTGVDISNKDEKDFEVVAALSGTVTDVREDSVLGNVIEIDHGKDVVTIYQSVKDIQVKVGDEVKKGQALATAGKSLFNEEAGVHVHFEIRKGDVPVNPLEYFNKPLSSLQEADVTKENKVADDSGKSQGNDAVEENKSNNNSTTDDKAVEKEDNSTDSNTNLDEHSVPSDNSNNTSETENTNG
ncbi:M23 family metallopeptidase [Bacillus sp. 03113]|uniref:M23 family metallopeptidase n=1 Tax=Bacillus sp. 03113 TaxID=2578211 RepID=UPI001141768A|nr:M23 family metallopeptidase [Bacillus sp. 03113]